MKEFSGYIQRDSSHAQKGELMNTPNAQNAERERIIKEIDALEMGRHHKNLTECVADFILADRARIVDPLVKFYEDKGCVKPSEIADFVLADRARIVDP